MGGAGKVCTLECLVKMPDNLLYAASDTLPESGQSTLSNARVQSIIWACPQYCTLDLSKLGTI